MHCIALHFGLQWNIERGYELDGIIEELKRLDADVLSLQEIDIGCARSNWEVCANNAYYSI